MNKTTRGTRPSTASPQPFVLCLTNTVAANFTANVLLSVGARPAMVENPDEAAELAAVADAVLVNVGTLTATQSEAMLAAVESCRAHGTPWVLDPVAIQVLAYRRAFVGELLSRGPALIRGNLEEIEFLRSNFAELLGSVPISAGSVPASTGSVPMLATGAVDEIFTGDSPCKRGQTLKIEGGVPMLQTVTATGCAQGAVCAAFLGRGQTPVEAAVSASKLMKGAGEIASRRAKTPGSFQVALLDALWELTHGQD